MKKEQVYLSFFLVLCFTLSFVICNPTDTPEADEFCGRNVCKDNEECIDEICIAAVVPSCGPYSCKNEGELCEIIDSRIECQCPIGLEVADGKCIDKKCVGVACDWSDELACFRGKCYDLCTQNPSSLCNSTTICKADKKPNPKPICVPIGTAIESALNSLEDKITTIEQPLEAEDKTNTIKSTLNSQESTTVEPTLEQQEDRGTTVEPTLNPQVGEEDDQPKNDQSTLSSTTVEPPLAAEDKTNTIKSTLSSQESTTVEPTLEQQEDRGTTVEPTLNSQVGEEDDQPKNDQSTLSSTTVEPTLEQQEDRGTTVEPTLNPQVYEEDVQPKNDESTLSSDYRPLQEETSSSGSFAVLFMATIALIIGAYFVYHYRAKVLGKNGRGGTGSTYQKLMNMEEAMPGNRGNHAYTANGVNYY